MYVTYALPISMTSFIDGSPLKVVAFEIPDTGYSGTYYITTAGHGFVHLDFSDFLVHTEYFPNEQAIKDYLEGKLYLNMRASWDSIPGKEVK